jgi:drug/metabolite transporter (DMT)-like permease
MNGTVFFGVILAAVLHASWNAIVKSSDDKFLSMSAVVLGHAPFALLAFAWVWAMPALAAWPFVIGSALLHVGYQFFLLWAYRIGDLSHVYPIARGSAPIVVTVISVLVLGERLSPLQLLAVALIGAGIMSLLIVRDGDGLRNGKAAILALATSAFIAGYTLVDGIGAREAGTPIGFYAWSTILNALLFAVIMMIAKPGLLRRVWPEARKTMAVGGGASFIAYAIAVWGFTQAPIALVAALRETSIIFALLIGVLVMKERLNLAKLLSTFITASGAVLLRLAR